jgi:TRAP-type C4-dicarboxylate transport system permease small subunit
VTQVAADGWLTKAEATIRLINRAFVFIACALVLIVSAVVLSDVFCRYVLGHPIEWAQDVSSFILLFIFFLALGPALESGSHVEVDLFDPLIPEGWRKAQRLVGKGVTLLFASVFTWFVWRHYAHIVEVDEMSFGMVMVPLAQIYWIGPVGAVMFLIVALLQFLRFALSPQGQRDGAPSGAH